MSLSAFALGQSKVEIIAHRGASGYVPEHTCEAVAMAHAMGADWIEQDVVLTKDDVPIVMHDIHLDTISDVADLFPDRQREDGRYYAIDFTLEEIKQLTASERFHPKTGRAVYPSRFPVKTGQFKIPTLAEELFLIQGLNRSTGRSAGIYPELKHPKFHHDEGKDLAAIVLKVLNEHGYTNRDHACIIQCFEWPEVTRLRDELKCDLKLVYLSDGKDWQSLSSEDLTTEFEKIAATADGIGPNVSKLFELADDGVQANGIIATAHQAGLMVHPWTFRQDGVAKPFASFEQMHEVAREFQLDGLFTDFPDLSHQLLNE